MFHAYINLIPLLGNQTAVISNEIVIYDRAVEISIFITQLHILFWSLSFHLTAININIIHLYNILISIYYIKIYVFVQV